MERMPMAEPVFRVDYRVIYGDTDSGGVVYHGNYLRYFEIGRTEMMRAWVMPYSEVERLGCIPPVTESYLRYKAPARYDDLLSIETSLVDVKKFTSRFNYRILRRENDGATLLVKGFTVHACVNRDGRLTPFPVELVEGLNRLAARAQSSSGR